MGNGHAGPGAVLRSAVALLICVTLCLSAAYRSEAADVEYVVHISVDGLRSDAIAFLGPGFLPNFHRMRVSGIYTDNARNDYDYTVTLPNHACMLTGRPVLGPDGHGVTFNSDPGTTFETVNGYYISGVFDAFHDEGYSTAMYASKSKFAFFERSWDVVNGAPDTVGTDYGRDKIDTYVNVGETGALIDSFVTHTMETPHRYSFIHFADPDEIGHESGWNTADYYNAVMKVDNLLGRIFDLIDEGPMTGVTAVIVTADHGGTGTSHDDPLLPENYTIPLYVTGPGVPAGYDLYAFNPVSRLDPGGTRPSYDVSPQPVRNGGSSNLALELMGLGPIAGSAVNAQQDLDVAVPGGGLPDVEITSPGDGDLFDSPATILIEATAHGNSIERVEFYADWIRIGEDTTSPYTCSWSDVTAGDYTIAARAVQADGIASVSRIDIGVVSVTGAAGEGFGDGLRIFPNPVRGRSTILFSLSGTERVEIVLYDALGRRLGTLVRGLMGPGSFSVPLDARGLEPGCYFYRMSLGSTVSSGKMLVLR